MNTWSSLLLAGAFAFPSIFQAAGADAPVSAGSATNNAQATLTFAASTADVSAPMILTNGYVSQAEATELEQGGKAIFNFTIAKAGDYVIAAMVNAPDDSSDSFFANVDALPEEPMMIWDIDVTRGFEERLVSWRGNGAAAGNAEFAPKQFNLSAGAHKLIIVGREPAQLKSISIRPAK